MDKNKTQIQFLGWEVLKFQFEQGLSEEKKGWSFYPEVQVLCQENSLLGKMLLHAHASFQEEKERSFQLSLLLQGLFRGEGITREEFEQYCLVQGSAYLIPPLRALVNDFLEKIRSLSIHVSG